MNLIDKLKFFLQNEEFSSLLENKSYRIETKNDLFYLFHLNNQEKMVILKDPNNNNRIRFKGTNLAFSVSCNEDGTFYLDHLLIGDVKKEEFDFIMRHEIINQKDKITIKLINNENIKYIYEIDNDNIKIDTISQKQIIKQNENKDIELKNQIDIQTYSTEFNFRRNENGNTEFIEETKDKAKEAFKAFLTLEKTYPTITSYINKRIPFLTDCIREASEIKDQKKYVYKKQVNSRQKR